MRWFVREGVIPGCGWGNGYVVVPKGHPLYGLDIYEYELPIHGGVTFGSWGKDMKWDRVNLRDDDWVIGFDTAHGYDKPSHWPKSAVVKETKRLVKLVDQYQEKDT